MKNFLFQTWLREHGFCELASHANIELIRTTAKLCMTPSGSAFCKYIILTLFGPSEEYYDVGLKNNYITCVCCT